MFGDTGNTCIHSNLLETLPKLAQVVVDNYANGHARNLEEVIGMPLLPCAVTRYASELYADVFTRCLGVISIGLRYFNVFGSRQDPDTAYFVEMTNPCRGFCFYPAQRATICSILITGYC